MQHKYKHSLAALNVRGWLTGNYYSPPVCASPYDQDVIRYAIEVYQFVYYEKLRPISLPEFADEIEQVYDCTINGDPINRETVRILRKYPLQSIKKGKQSPNDKAQAQALGKQIKIMIERNIKNERKNLKQNQSVLRRTQPNRSPRHAPRRQLGR